MEKKFRAFRVAVMVSALGGASALLLSGATPAKAAEERLHSSTVKVYGLIPPGENTKDNTTNRGTRADTNTTTTTKASFGIGGSKPAGSSVAGNEPKLEDPPMPSYNGPNDGGNTMASNDVGGGQVSNN